VSLSLSKCCSILVGFHPVSQTEGLHPTFKINRILFLKLLEAQIIRYHRGDKSLEFLNLSKIADFDDLNRLFFSVLAKKQSERSRDIQNIYTQVPYLNSSLFEPTELEQSTIVISNLRSENLEIFVGTVLKDSQGKKRTGEINALAYLFEFLNAYDFSSEGGEAIQEDNKTLINASVLGLIFEKINGYKDGSFFTPGFITMYMCRETIRRAVIEKFNQSQGWDCQTIEDVYNRIKDKTAANAIINSLKICDPAVGSGHFLVSALNEIIAIKSELQILVDKEGKTLRDYRVEVVNDELIVTDDDGNIFEYNPRNRESQRVQETLFQEKQRLIEGCLFGVDINPNSVKICRLRLWIELLKNAYYKADNELETLPNIDINIKVGNSLISRFGLSNDLQVFSRKSRLSIESYKDAVRVYRNAEDKSQKREMERLISEIKGSFRQTLQGDNPQKKRLRGLETDLYSLENQILLFEESAKEKKAREKKISQLRNEIDKLRLEIEEIESGKIYHHAFEWRFEFPEVLDDKGDFIGFDVVIGNPPYLTYHGRRRVVISNEITTYFKNNYSCVQGSIRDGKLNSAMFFIEKATLLGNKNCISCLITDISFYEHFYEGVKKKLICDTIILEVVNGLTSFEDVGSGQVILMFRNVSADQKEIISKNQVRFLENGLESNVNQIYQLEWNNLEKRYQFYLPDKTFTLILDKIENNAKPLDFYFPNKLIRTGESIGIKEKGFVIDCMLEDVVKIYDYLEGSKSVPSKYCNPIPTRWFRFDIDLLNQRNAAYRLEAEKSNRSNPKVLGIGDQLAFENPKILIRQSCDHLCCTYTEEAFVYNRSYYSISNENTSGKSSTSLFFILGLLNSHLFTYYARKKRIIRMEIGKQPQIRLNDLKKMPIKIASNDCQQSIEKPVDQILAAKKSDPNADTSELEREIDHLVYKLYQLTYDEVKIIDPEFTMTEQEYEAIKIG